jgi:(p)ppGpp synthase/HD superfamily hydrolase
MVELAESIARRAHHGQTEESTGDPYLRHVQRVVAMVDGNEAKAVAWLHDVIEDSPVTAAGLLAAGLPVAIVSSVTYLTRLSGSYAEYIERLKASGDSVAISVKIADLRDHLRPNCPARLRPRYEAAWSVLTSEPLPANGSNTAIS